MSSLTVRIVGNVNEFLTARISLALDALLGPTVLHVLTCDQLTH